MNCRFAAGALGVIAVVVGCGGSVERADAAASAAGRVGTSRAGATAGALSGLAPRGGASAGGSSFAAEPALELSPAQYEQLQQGSVCQLPIGNEAVPLTLLFVVDGSASMLESSDASSGITQWALAQEATWLAIDRLRPEDAAGLLLFPNRLATAVDVLPSDSCVATAHVEDVEPLGNSATAKREALRAAIASVAPAGGSPIADAYRMASLLLGPPAVRPYVVLITDGLSTFAAGCVGNGTETTVLDDSAAVVQAIAGARTRGIGTIVAGTKRNHPAVTPSAEVRDWLSNAATAGGTSIPESCSPSGNPKFCHVDLTQGTSGLADLVTTIGRRPPCEFSQDGSPADKQVNLLFHNPVGKSVLYLETGADCPAGEGYYRVPSTNHLRLCPQTCARVGQEPFGAIALMWACSEPPPWW